jgi:hypothetical protein
VKAVDRRHGWQAPDVYAVDAEHSVPLLQHGTYANLGRFYILLSSLRENTIGQRRPGGGAACAGCCAAACGDIRLLVY